ncbi:MAG: fused MFS/spermidine synthase [Verrucomicrobia bacterium]|nr:fused MFS/spermidine synthase [Verrucomicrobiota bacterium]
MTVLLLFFCSGATALVYEVLWSKHLALVLGSTVQAQTVVLAVFMGGLALGNRLFGRRADAVSHPLALYGKLEIAIGFYALIFHLLHSVADKVFIGVGTPLLEVPVALLALKAVLSVGLLLGPTILMGGTLPLIAAWLNRRGTDAGRLSARFYSVNSLGAVCGAWLAGFLLVPALGMTASIQLTAMVNVAIGLTALGLARKTVVPAPCERRLDEDRRSQTTATGATDLSLITNYSSLSLAIVALTGAISMSLEVLASRSLVLLFGASLQAFAIVLMSFILGIGLGGAVMASPRTRGWTRETATMALLLGAAVWLGLLIAGVEQWVDGYRWVKTGIARTETGFTFHQAFAAVMSVVVLGIPAGLLGAVLPLWIRDLPQSGPELGRGVGRLLTWNTLGAVAGTLVTGFVLMPQLGLRGAFLALALGLCVAAWLLGRKFQRVTLQFTAATVGAALLMVGAMGGDTWRHLLSSGIFRLRETEIGKDLVGHRQRHIKIRFYEDAADASVAVEQGDGVGASDQFVLRINGKPDATSRGDMATQFLLAHLPMLARPDSKDIFVLGFGSGVTAGALLGHPIGRVTVAENCAPVLRAGEFFAPWNRGVLTNPLARIVPEDARTLLKLSPQRYDVIISEPSNPWMVGVGSVFSREFYELCAGRLKAGGIMTQWFHVYEMHDGIVALVLHTFASVFPHVELWDPGTGDIILLGSQKPWATGPDVWRKVFERAEPGKDLAAIGLHAPEALWARQFASQGTTRAFIENGPEQSDEFPVLEYEAPKAFFIGSSAKEFLQFDERTRQHPLASPAKRAALNALSAAMLAPVFPQFGSVNPEAGHAANARVHSLTNTAAPSPPPSIFTQPRSSESYQTLVANVEDWIRSSATNQVPMSHDDVADALRECLARGDLDRAKIILKAAGRTMKPGAELRFLERMREQAGGKP